MSNPNCAETYALLRIVGPNVDPDELTRSLGIQPTQSVKVGSVHPNGTKPRKEGIWGLSTEGELSSTELEDHIRLLLDRLKSTFKDHIPAGARSEIHCVWRSATGHGGPVISSSTLARVSGANLDLDFDFYSDV